ncbi:hypothetical protein DID97_07820 [Burkholderia sp. Bp8977]|nr:hypothetical protein DIE10_11590 [Burkholderia sp. Bp9011]RQR94220.1 hypothetical protein DIE09_11775 [Burkholderia sp. Bp9010]RQS11695.1 hypothetical protein DIE02_07560 [Burkholderia sp. Bp8991]RQS79366.1 hypothetical protein DID97_07820 [Burkholderia sp. Bp8977]
MFLYRRRVRQYRPDAQFISFPENMGNRSISKMSGVELAVPPVLDMPFGKQSRRVVQRRGAVNAIRMRTC